MLNKVILTGKVGRAPKFCVTQEGKELVSFSLATSVYWRDEAGEWQSATDWHHIAVFRESTIRWLKGVLKRGDPLYVEGKLTYHSWIDKFGQKRLSSHVVITNREGRVEYLRSSPFQNTVSQPPNLISNLNVQDTSQPASLEEESHSEQKNKSESTSLQIEPTKALAKVESHEENQSLSH